MARSANINQKICAYHGEIDADPNHRYRSWEHCYCFFRRIGPGAIVAQRDNAALQLGFYLASWGMYRGSGFLLKHSYTVHLGVVDLLASPSLSPLWENDFGSRAEDSNLKPIILGAIDAVREAYSQFGQASDTLVTKVILGTFGCLPACDRYFIEGFKSGRLKYSRVDSRFVDSVLDFCRANLKDLQNEQARIEASSGVRYPLMKLVDMYFWQIGGELSTQG